MNQKCKRRSESPQSDKIKTKEKTFKQFNIQKARNYRKSIILTLKESLEEQIDTTEQLLLLTHNIAIDENSQSIK